MSVVLASVGFWAPVTFARVGDDCKPEVLKFRTRFKRLKKTERLELEHRLAAGALSAEMREAMQVRMDDPKTKAKDRDNLRAALEAEPMDDEEFLNTMVIDWELKDREGKFIAYAIKERQEQEEELDGLETAIVQAFFNARKEALTPEAIAKNSGARRGTSS